MKVWIASVFFLAQAAMAFAAEKCDPVHDEMERKIELFQKHSARLLELPENCTPTLASVAQDVVNAAKEASNYVDKHNECALASVDAAIAHMKAASGYPRKLLETCPQKK